MPRFLRLLLGMRLGPIGMFVMGDVFLVFIHFFIAHRSYVIPSSAT